LSKSLATFVPLLQDQGDANFGNLKIYLYLGILWTARRDYEKSLKFFKDAEQIYLSYKQQTGGGPKAMEEYITKPWDEDKLERKRMVEFEKTYTLTLYYMAQVYAKRDEKELSAEYCQITLQRQLEWDTYE
jgi:hypothetical protein